MAQKVIRAGHLMRASGCCSDHQATLQSDSATIFLSFPNYKCIMAVREAHNPSTWRSR
jgi:hypothetical protein